MNGTGQFRHVERRAAARRDRTATTNARQAEGCLPRGPSRPHHPDGRMPAGHITPGPCDSGLNPVTDPRRHTGPRPLPRQPKRQRILTASRGRPEHVLQADRLLFPAVTAAADVLHAVRCQWLQIGTDTTGRPIYCHVLDIPDAYRARLSGIDKRALRAAQHRARQSGRVSFDAAAFPSGAITGAFAPVTLSTTVELRPCADVFAAVGLTPEAGEQRNGVEAVAIPASHSLPRLANLEPVIR